MNKTIQEGAVFPNNKPWLNPDLKVLLNRKERGAFRTVRSPILFTLYMVDFNCNSNLTFHLQSFSDDLAIVGMGLS